MANSLAELIERQAQLEREINAAQLIAKAEAIAEVRRMTAEYGLTVADIASPLRPAQRVATGKKVPPKFRDPRSGSTWSGRGLKPKWLAAALDAGKSLRDFVI